LEVGLNGLESPYSETPNKEQLRQALRQPTWDRMWHIAESFRQGFSLYEVNALTGVDLWFLANIEDLVLQEQKIAHCGLTQLDYQKILTLKQKGFADARIADLLGISEAEFR